MNSSYPEITHFLVWNDLIIKEMCLFSHGKLRTTDFIFWMLLRDDKAAWVFFLTESELPIVLVMFAVRFHQNKHNNFAVLRRRS